MKEKAIQTNLPNAAQDFGHVAVFHHPSRHHSVLAELLNDAASCISEIGYDLDDLRLRLVGLKTRLMEGRFHVAVLGQFKRGKSALLNALLGRSVLPTSVIPLTSVPTFIRFGDRLRARIACAGGCEIAECEAEDEEQLCTFLKRFVTEEGNPRNSLGVSEVEVFVPAEILRRGVILIDTPGIGSTYRHNTESTEQFLPQCDAALFVLSADPPMTEIEMEFLKRVRERVANIFFIFNKIDYLHQKDQEEAITFLKKVLSQEVDIQSDFPIFCVSARYALEAKQRNDTSLLSKSGIVSIEEDLLGLLAKQKNEMLRGAIAFKASEIIDEIIMRSDLLIRSLETPLEELKRRLGALENTIQEAERERVVMADLLAGDQKRLIELLEEQAEELGKGARDYLRGIVDDLITQDTTALIDEEHIQAAVANAIPEYFDRLSEETTKIVQERTAEILRPYQHKVEALGETIRRTAAELFSYPYRHCETGEGFVLSRRPYWVTRRFSNVMSPISSGFIDKILPLNARRKRLRNRLIEQVEALVSHNISNLHWALSQSINQSFLDISSFFDDSLADAVAATRGAIKAVMDKRQAHEGIVCMEVRRLEGVKARLGYLKGAIGAECL